ncbi:MAG TPA: GAF domain-containing protein [Methylomirabilota bacterium]|nr:GAF domain-containing protein [Methylomirabilota bacterium]
MKIGRLFPDLLATLGRAASPEAGFARTLTKLIALSGARAGGLCFEAGRGAALRVTAGVRRGSPLDRWLRSRLDEPIRGVKIQQLGEPPPGWRRGRPPVLLRASLGDVESSVGRFLLLGPGGPRGLGGETIPPGFPREFGLAMEQVWRLHQRTLRLEVINEITSLMASTLSLERIYGAVAEAVGRLIRFDALGVSLLDRDRGEVHVLDVAARTVLPEVYDVRIPAADTLTEWVAAERASRRVDDASDPALPGVGREMLTRRGFRSAVVAPLVSEGEVIGTLNVLHRQPGAFTDADVEVLTEVARPLASAIEHSRLHAETERRAEEMAALNRTSQLITARLDLNALLETISRSVTGLMGSTGCGIGLLNADRTVIQHVAAHGFKTHEWRGLSMPVGEGIIGRCAATGQAVRSDDLSGDPRSAQRDVDEKEGIRSMLSVPLRVAGEIIGVISAFSTTPHFFTSRHQTLLDAFADQAGIAIHNARLFEESRRRERETDALLKAGRAVNQSLEVGETVRLILNQAREVLGVQSCGLFTLDPATGELTSVASLDLEVASLGAIRLQVGEGITGTAVKERRPVQSADLFNDPRVRYPQLSAERGLRSMLAAPLVVGEHAIGALTVLRRDVHHFTPDEESLLSAFADQAAMALEHARLFSSVRTYSAQLEAMVAARTRELDEQKRFVEVVLETLPLGLFVLDAGWQVVSANREGAALLPTEGGRRRDFLDLLPPATAGRIRTVLESVLADRRVRQIQEDLPGAETLTVRVTAAPLRSPAGETTHVLVLIEDITMQKRLERQMLLTERLTTAGRLAAGVAHELNNPLATIAGCAEALKERAADPQLRDLDAFKDFPTYLSLIEEETYRCKEITGSLLQFVRDPGSRRAPSDLNALVEKALGLLSRQARFVESRLETDLDPELPAVVANEGQIRQVFLGLAGNALEAMDGRGTLTVRTRRRGATEVEVVFEDHGPGIPEQILPRIFDAFFTTKAPGQGTGLGLAIAQGIVADHGGRIEVATRGGAGSAFRVILPLEGPASERAAPGAPDPRTATP